MDVLHRVVVCGCEDDLSIRFDSIRAQCDSDSDSILVLNITSLLSSLWSPEVVVGLC